MEIQKTLKNVELVMNSSGKFNVRLCKICRRRLVQVYNKAYCQKHRYDCI